MTEDEWMNPVRETWADICQQQSLKPQTPAHTYQLYAYMRGVIAVARATNIMTAERAAMISLLVFVNRGADFLALKEPTSAHPNHQ